MSALNDKCMPEGQFINLRDELGLDTLSNQDPPVHYYERVSSFLVLCNNFGVSQ